MPRQIQTKLSNYEGFKRLDQLLEKIAYGRLKPPGSENKTEHWCDFCKCHKRSQQLVPTRLMGKPVSKLGIECKTAFKGLFVLACSECAGEMTRARVT